MILAIVNANQWVLDILVLSMPLVLLGSLLVIMSVSLCLSLSYENLVVQILKLICSSDSLFDCSRWHNSCSIPLYDWL